ncbi:MAG: hypothetical protein MJ137_09390, partial [Clostridia bacterium]|nr:hypothetical protein [Clostridia bacterium]
MYIYEAALEYMTELLVSSTYLAKVSSSLGMTASQIGILSSFVSLAEGGTLAALLLVRKTPVKRWVVPLSVLNQLAFATLYFIPL